MRAMSSHDGGIICVVSVCRIGWEKFEEQNCELISIIWILSAMLIQWPESLVALRTCKAVSLIPALDEDKCLCGCRFGDSLRRMCRKWRWSVLIGG